MKIIFNLSILSVLMAFTGKDKLTGRWQTLPSLNGNVTTVVFKPDNTFEGFINKKPFASGIYSLENDVFSFTDNGCQGMRGTYKIVLFSNSDSLRFVVVSDSCTQRKAGMERLVFGRAK